MKALEESIFHFCNFDYFYDKFKPITPYGIDFKRRKLIYNDKADLNGMFNRIELFLKLIKESPDKVSRIEYHLKNIPSLAGVEKERHAMLSGIDFFLIKKLLNNYLDLINNLSPEIVKSFKVFFSSGKFINILNKGGKGGDTFYISEKYSKELKVTREKINKINKSMENEKNKCLEQIKKKCSLDFNDRDFLIVNHEIIAEYDQNLLFIEPYDSDNYVIKPVYTERYISLNVEKKRLLVKEKKYEIPILKMLSDYYYNDKNITEYIKIIRDIDVFLAKARLCSLFNMNKPVISEHREGAQTVFPE